MKLSAKVAIFFIVMNSNFMNADQKMIIANLSKVLPEGVQITAVESSPIEGVFIVDIGDLQPIYVTKDGNFFFYGDLYQVETGGISNLTTKHENAKRKQLLNNELQADEFISFKSQNEKFEVVVFTDVDCQYCRKFHKEIDEYNKLGISVNYVAFPRNGLESESYNKIVGAWCSNNPKEILTLQKLGQNPDTVNCLDNPVSKHYFLGRKIGISGTPAIIRSDGALIPGYVPPNELIKRLENG
ncbi:MAG: thioredoxin fold domain-containing protein [Gammaproteobacteria bacterium]